MYKSLLNNISSFFSDNFIHENLTIFNNLQDFNFELSIIINSLIHFFNCFILDFNYGDWFGWVIGCFIPCYIMIILFASPMDLSQMVSGELSQELEQRRRYQAPEIVDIGFESYKMHNNFYIYLYNKNKPVDDDSPIRGFILGLSGRNSFPIRHEFTSLPETNRQAHCTILTIPCNSLNNIRTFTQSNQSRIRVQCNPLAFSNTARLLTSGNQPIFPNNIEQERIKTFTDIHR